MRSSAGGAAVPKHRFDNNERAAVRPRFIALERLDMIIVCDTDVDAMIRCCQMNTQESPPFCNDVNNNLGLSRVVAISRFDPLSKRVYVFGRSHLILL